MDVEILGVLKDAIGPGQDMILARLHGTKPEYTGVVAGMSGSPVYIDGRLLGALSYRIGQFSKEPIAGITPIEQMFEVRDTDGHPEPKAAITGNTPQLQPMETPLVFTGFTQEAVDRFGDRFRALGMIPVAGLGGMDPEAKQPEPLVAGSAVSAVLVRGDIAMTGTCTVTYIDPTQLLACGHPITQYGNISIPMTKATVVATLPSPLNAFKIVNATETVGAFTQDRASAIYGRFDAKAHMIPVTVEVTGAAPAVKARTLHFEVLDNRQLTPSSMLISVYQCLQSTNNSAAEISYRLTGQLTATTSKGDPLPPLRLNAELAQSDFNPAAITAALYIGERFDRIYQNAVEQPIITGLTLHVEATPTRRTATVETAHLSRFEARPGETVEVETTLRPYQSAPRLVRMSVQVPAGAQPGPMRVMVSDGATLDRLLQPTAPISTLSRSPTPSPRPIASTPTTASTSRSSSMPLRPSSRQPPCPPSHSQWPTCSTPSKTVRNSVSTARVPWKLPPRSSRKR